VRHVHLGGIPGLYLSPPPATVGSRPILRMRHCRMRHGTRAPDLVLSLLRSNQGRAQRFKSSADHTLRRFEGALQGEGQHYLFGSSPTIADFFLFEALEGYASAFGWAHLHQQFPVLVRVPPLLGETISYPAHRSERVQSSFHARVSNRDRIRAYLASAKRHTKFSGSPAEEDVLHAMQALTKPPTSD
jgi:hypothetical protein